jgi:hypothetical protein
MVFRKISKLLFAAGAVCAAVNASTVFNFENDSPGTATNFTDTVNGLSATFSSAADPGGFVVYCSIYETLTGNVLGDPGPAGLNNLGLSINFNGNLSAVTLDFATSDFSVPSALTLTAYENSKLVGSASASGNFLQGFTFPEGEIAFDGGTFNQLVISSTATDFAVDNIAVISSAPEPAVPALVAFGLLAFGIPSLRSKARRTSPVKQ